MIEHQTDAVRLRALGDPASLAYEQISTPRPGPREVLVQVHAAAITRGELDWPEDLLPATPSYEFSGVVVAIGAGVEDVEVGEAVYALIDFNRDGAAAEYTIVPEEILAPKPRTLGYLESAAIPLRGEPSSGRDQSECLAVAARAFRTSSPTPRSHRSFKKQVTRLRRP
jgi:NADPH:quinone reductase-like Zn-dependent oxidoreductase